VAKERQYIDLNVELRDLDRATDKFKVALSSPAVGESEVAEAPYGRDELEDNLDRLDRKRIDLADLIALGEQLTARLLPSEQIRQLFKNALSKAGQDGGVRLRLLIREPALAQLPWEFSYLQLHEGELDRRHFLILNPKISMVRHEALPEEHPTLAAATPEKLRLVAAMSNPENGYRKLDLKYERGVIEKALRDFSVDGVSIEWEPFIENATVNDITTALVKGADLFHFAGHGKLQEVDVDPETNQPVGVGYLAVVRDKETREPFLWPAGDVASWLQNAGVRVAVLGACDSGRRDGVTAWTSLAPALIERGIPAVVAMQYEVLDKHAAAFSQMFYTTLASGASVDEAVWAGRQAMLGISNQDDVEWGVPVLYMRSPNGVLFPKLSERESETRDQIRRIIQQTVETIEQGGEVIGIEAKRIHGGFEIVQKATTVKGRLVGASAEDLF